MRSICFLAFVLCTVVPGFAYAWELAWTAKLGGEYDTNVERVLGDNQSSDGVLRGFAAADFRARVAQQGVLSVGTRLGARVPATTRVEDSVTSQVMVSGRRLSQLRAVWWGGGFDVRDVMLRSNIRDYTRVGGRMSFGAEPGAWRIGLHGGASQLFFHPQPSLSSLGPELLAELFYEPFDGLELGISGDTTFRYYSEARLVERAGTLRHGDEDRRDVVAAGGARVRYSSGAMVAMSAYRVQRGQSNSIGRSYLRHSLDGEFSLVPFGEVLLRLAGRLLLTRYDDPANIDATLLLDDDSRSSVSFTIEVPVFRDLLAVEARGERFADRGSDPAASYGRWVAYLGLSVRGSHRSARR